MGFQKNILEVDVKLLCFGIGWALINMLPYLLMRGGQQLGWMYLVTFGLAMPLGSIAFDLFLKIYLYDKRKFYGMACFFAVMGLFVLFLFAVYFIPAKYTRRVIIDGYAKVLFHEAARYKTEIAGANVYIIDETKDKYNLNEIFTSTAPKIAFALHFIDTPPAEVFIVQAETRVQVAKKEKRLVFVYSNHHLTRLSDHF